MKKLLGFKLFQNFHIAYFLNGKKTKFDQTVIIVLKIDKTKIVYNIFFYFLKDKMSSSSSYSSSPPSSPTHSRKFFRSDIEVGETKLNEFDTVSCDELKTTPTTGTSVTNHSSNESVNQDEFVIVSDSRKPNEDLEAAYITNVSKNPITLRKTESLRIESVQSIRNRFDRVNCSAASALNRAKHDLMNNSIDENGQRCPSPPNLITSPLSSSLNNGKQTTPIPLLLNTSNNSSFGQQNESNIANSSCIKKRVWTPVQSSSNLSNGKLNDSNSTPNNTNDVSLKFS